MPALYTSYGVVSRSVTVFRTSGDGVACVVVVVVVVVDVLVLVLVLLLVARCVEVVATLLVVLGWPGVLLPPPPLLLLLLDWVVA